uniref:Spy0128 family protein n=1 Tax=Collinsella aerofaciens TaxID=74426 RepID=UPI003D7AA67F
MSKYTRGLLAVILAVVLVLPAAAFAMLPEANARSSTGMDGPTVSGKIVDPHTSDNWTYWAAGSDDSGKITTQNVGRIWTDKTVEAGEGSDFLTTLSAISSTSNTTTTVPKPLDIVLVLDASGSMNDPMSSSDRTKRIDALKTAANSFIEKIAEENAKISDESKQHRVAIVKFSGYKTDEVGNGTYREGGHTYNYSQIMKSPTPCLGDGVNSLKSTVSSISPAGATRADYGMDLAKDISGRADAKKVVLFFTDGSPTSYSSFEPSVANGAINKANSMKKDGTVIYTIGIFSGANPSADPTASSTINENKFMHAVSSNYPAASSSISYWGEWTINFGARAENANYYKSAKNAKELEDIFKDISESITEVVGYPTETHDGYANKSGYITFTDELGDYMQVDNFTEVEYNGTTFVDPVKSTTGNVDAYAFAGEAANLVITVQRAAAGGPQQGDIVEVKIPASLIPLRNFDVDETKGTLTVNDVDPIRVKYASSVKAIARENLFTPDEALKKYIDENAIDEQGSKSVAFYANKWSGDPDLGDTIANFKPAATNRYYFFQKQTPIYTDPACTQPAKEQLASDRLYYYQDEFEIADASRKLDHGITVIEFAGRHAAQFADAVVADESGNLSFSAGTARLAFIDELHTDKNPNATGTASDVLNPRWNDTSSKATATHVNSYLGNNGKISYKYNMTPATVDTKASFGLTKVLEGRAWTDADEFKFELSATSENDAPMPTSATATVTKDNTAIGFGEITYTEPGTYVYKVSEKNAGTTVDGITYSGNVAEITVTVTPNKKGKLSAAVEVTSGKAKFENTYTTNPVESSVTSQIAVAKVLTGRDLTAGEFSFELREVKGGDSELIETVENDAEGNVTFKPIKYTEIGQHTYTLHEVAGDAGGIDYDNAVYTIVTTIADNGKGELVATHELKGAEGVKSIEFKNAYNLTPESFSVTDQITATKSLDGRDLKAGEFSFELVEGNDVVATGTNDARGKITMTGIEYTAAGEHTYTLREVNGGTTSNGISYDGKTYTIVTTITDNGDGTLGAAHKLQGAETAEFKNSYNLTPSSSSVTDQITATKVLDGRDLKEGEFSFELVEGDEVVATGTNAVDGTITMNSVKYDKAGKHTYTLREVKGSAGGITYSDAKYTIETTITDKGDGTLEAKHVLKDADEAKFSNSYKPGSKESSVTDQITAAKSLDGRDLKAGEFRFELVEGNSVVSTGTNNADGKIVMDSVTYTAAGEHTYTLRETKASTTENGITYSTAEYTIVTIVKDNGDGTLSMEHKLQNADEAIFENTYTVTPKSSSVTDQIKATKSLTGRDLKEGEFSFELVEGDEVVATGTNNAEGKITMSPIEYTAAGKHAYTLREVPSDAGNGITYDGKTYTIETTITDNGRGELVAKHELKGDDEAKFSNSYKPNPGESSVTDQITATKVLDGRDLKEGEFSFELVEGNDVVATGKNAADGTITMSPVKYDKAGAHTYTLREVKGGTTSKGVTYSDAKFTIETTITDNGDGTLEAKHVLKGDEPAEFKNTYSVTPLDAELDFGLSKAVDGRAWTDSDEFSFTITAAEGTPLPDPATVTVSKKDAKDGIAAIKFGKIHYAAAGTYKYEIRENVGNAAGMKYDDNVATAEVTVTENGEGNLTANVTKKENGRFTNTYRSELDYAAAGGLKLSKTLSGRPMTEGQFTFTVTPADEASANALGLHEGANTFKSPATAEGTVGLIDILAGHEVKFTQADAGKTFTYTVAEKNDGKPGYTYDDAERTVTIAVADDGAGTLTATTTVSGPEGTHETIHKSGENKVESAVVPFENSYSATTNTTGGEAAQIVATKKLTGRPMVNGEFYFGIAYAGETEAIEGTCVTNINGQVSFGALHYDTEMLANLVSANRAIRTDTDAKLAWTINYTAFEYTNLLADQGITAAKSSFSFKVIVVDNGDGTLTASPDYAGAEPVFENVYGAEAVDAALAGTKKLQAAEGLTPGDIAGKFTFTVTADEAGAPMPERTTAANDAAGNVDFGKIHFTLDDLNRALGVTANASGDASSDAEANADKAEVDADEADANAESKPVVTAPRSHTFTYTVTESGSAPGVANDANATRKVSYTVTDDGAGHLKVVRNGDDGAAFTFTNTYSVAPTDSSMTDQVKTVKRLTGRDLAAGEFTFELLEDGVVVASGTNDANGTVTLSPIHYEAPGTHTYTLREACPNALGLYKGVTYDGTTYTVATTVSDNGDGTLTATHKLEGTTESAGFTNKYHAMPTQVSIGAIKVLEGRELKKDEFSFKLVGEDVESTVTNDADGKINFDKFEYDKPGTYVYTISEVKG